MPRPASEDLSTSVRPCYQRTKLDVGQVCQELGLDVNQEDVKVIADPWAKKLLDMEDTRCSVICKALVHCHSHDDT